MQQPELPRFFLLNPTSLAKTSAKEQLFADVQSVKADVVMIDETWFTHKHSNTDVDLSGFTLYRRDRSDRKGGGLCVYVRDNILCSYFYPNSAHATRDVEIMWLKLYCCDTTFYIALCYHPPKPVYSEEKFVAQLSDDIDYIMSDQSESVLVVAGDFNMLSTDFLVADYGLCQLVVTPTHGGKILDKFFINRPDFYQVKVFKSIVKTKHMAILAEPLDGSEGATCNIRRKVTIYDTREHNIDRLRHELGTFDWSLITSLHPINDMYNAFLTVLKAQLNTCIPCKSVTLSNKDPFYITPLVKSLLVKRNRLRRRGKLVEADNLAQKINISIADVKRKQYVKMTNSNAKELWNAVKGKSSKITEAKKHAHILTSPDFVNKFFATIATANDYNIDAVLSLRNDVTAEEYNLLNDDELDELGVEPLLRKLKNTAPGCDNIPAWVFRTCSYELAGVVSFIINYTIRAGSIPANWLTATVTPVPKCAIPNDLSDFRPISVTPILSRLTEKILVRKWLIPAFKDIDLSDQYAFKPTGSTNCALINCINSVAQMLEENNYVRCLMVDFAKAFDTVDHAIVLTKLNTLPIPSPVKNWMIAFLTGRTQITRVSGRYSTIAEINRSIVQGSGIGPYLYILMEKDLCTLSAMNVIFKYADDTNVLVPEHSDVSLAAELANIQDWARINKMTINLSKTKEIVFHRPHPSKFTVPFIDNNIERVTDAKLLGVILSDNLSFEKHINAVLATCSQRFYLMKLLRDGGMPLSCLDVVFCSLIVSRITYCLSAWGGLITADQVDRINAVFKRAKRYGFTDEDYIFEGLLECADSGMFASMQTSDHCLHHLLPAVRQCASQLRARGHDFILPKCCFTLYKRSFLPRCLYKYFN